MTPPRNTSHSPSLNRSTAPQPARLFASDQVSDMTFDELREMPVRMQLGLDLSALD